MAERVSRRVALQSAAALTGSAVLTGCLSFGSSTSTTSSSLEERAESEGKVRLATSITGIEEFNDSFEDDTDIEYDQLRTDANKVATRVIQESKAGKLSFDYRRGSDPDTTISMHEAGAFADVPDTIAEQWPDRVRYNGKLIADWMGLKLSLLYDENKVESPPTTLSELATDFAGEYTVDVRDEFIWVALRERHGEQKAKELVRQLGEGAEWRESHYAPLQDIARGEVSMALTYNKFKYYDDFSDVVAEQELEDLPKIVRQISSVKLKNANHPAAAELYMRYSQKHIQEFLQNTGRPDAYFDPSNVIGNDEFFIWDSEAVSNLDLEAESKTWRELSGLSN